MPRGLLAQVCASLLPLITDMATDPRKLKPGELCRLLNSTDQGEVITDRSLRAQRSRAGLRIGNGQSIDLFRYVAWLVDELPAITPEEPPEVPRSDSVAGQPVNDLHLRWRCYESIPQKDWIEMSGRQAKVLNEQAERYGLPFGSAVIHLPRLVRALHDFLAIHARRLARYLPAESENAEQGEEADNMELYRGERYLRERLKRMAEERALLPRLEVHEAFAQCASILRSAGDILQRQFGRDAHQVLEEAISECERRMTSLSQDDQQPDA